MLANRHLEKQGRFVQYYPEALDEWVGEMSWNLEFGPHYYLEKTLDELTSRVANLTQN